MPELADLSEADVGWNYLTRHLATLRVARYRATNSHALSEGSRMSLRVVTIQPNILFKLLKINVRSPLVAIDKCQNIMDRSRSPQVATLHSIEIHQGGIAE